MPAALVWCLTLGGLTTSAQTLPNSSAGRAMSAILGFIDSGDAAGFEQYARGAFTPEFLRGLPADRMAQNITRLKETTGGLALAEIRTMPDGALEVNTTARRDPAFKARFVLRLAPNHRISELRLAMFDPAQHQNPYAGVPPSSSLAERMGAIGKVLESESAAGRFSGTLIIAQNGQPKLERATGLANRAFSVPNTVETKFHIGSITKMFTAIAIAQLAAAGKLSFDDPISKYLPDYPDQPLASRITVHHLLTHTSGLGDYQSSEYQKRRWSLDGLSDHYRFFASQPLRFDPGKGWGYSNAGFLLLGLIVERVTGQSYTGYVTEHVFKPAGMNESGFDVIDDLTPRLAVGYTRITKEGSREGPLKSNVLTLPFGSPAGGAFSTARDLLKFAEALQSNRLLDAKHTQMVTSAKAKPDGPPELFYGYGFRVLTINRQRAFGHGGSVPGGSAELFIFPETGLVVVALANIDPPAAGRLVTPICELLTQTPATVEQSKP